MQLRARPTQGDLLTLTSFSRLRIVPAACTAAPTSGKLAPTSQRSPTHSSLTSVTVSVISAHASLMQEADAPIFMFGC